MKVLLFCDFALPDSCADATRVLNFAKLLKCLGHDVELLGVAYKHSGKSLCGTVGDISFEMLSPKMFTGIKAPIRVLYLNKDIKNFLNARTYDAIILSGVYYDFSKTFCKYAKRHGAKLIVNALEWYDKSNIQFVGIRGKINFLKNRIALTRIFPKMHNIIAISSLLSDYYGKRNCNVVNIPTIIDISEYSSVANADTIIDTPKTRIAYAGSPGRKDYILNAIRALELLSDEEKSQIVLDFYGPTIDQLYSLGLSPEFLDKHKENVICHGRIPYGEVKEKIASADFTVLLRPNKRYANAGFPTKVGESMACGTPVIANITSDLGKYIIDGKTGIVCENESPEACAAAFRRALSLSADERQIMRKEALDMAKTAFNYESYVDAMAEFLNK